MKRARHSRRQVATPSSFAPRPTGWSLDPPVEPNATILGEWRNTHLIHGRTHYASYNLRKAVFSACQTPMVSIFKAVQATQSGGRRRDVGTWQASQSVAGWAIEVVFLQLDLWVRCRLRPFAWDFGRGCPGPQEPLPSTTQCPSVARPILRMSPPRA